jgi:hypothetical protein
LQHTHTKMLVLDGRAVLKAVTIGVHNIAIGKGAML